MRTTTVVSRSVKRPARHFDRGFRSALRGSLPAVALIAACSGSLNTSDPGSGGTGGGGDAGGTGSECGGFSGAGNCVLSGQAGAGGTTGIGGADNVGTAGIGGIGGGGATGGTGGSGGSVPLPACTASGVTFGVCIGNDAEGTSPTSLDTHTSGAATIEAVGVAAPVSCRRAIGKGGPSDWWFQARAADNRLWTIGVQGLGGSTPLVRQGDVVTLDADWKTGCAGPANCFSDGRLQLSDAAGTPLLWAGARSILGAFPNPTWISFAAGDYVCGSVDMYCDRRERNVSATVNGSSMTLPPDGAASIGGYLVEAPSHFPASLCGDSGPNFLAAAVKVSPSTDP
jgi:hypothetical protein